MACRNGATRHCLPGRPMPNDLDMTTTIGRDVPTVATNIRRLLLATDLSDASERAADEAIRLALESGATLVVLSVVDPRRLRLPGGRFLRRIDQERARIEEGVRVLTDRARAAGAHVTFLVWE